MVTRVDRDLQYEIERFLYYEARLLDQGRFHEWLELFTDDMRYWMPIRVRRATSSRGVSRLSRSCLSLSPKLDTSVG